MKPLVLLVSLATIAFSGACHTAPLNPASVTTATKLDGTPAMAVRAGPSVWTHTDSFSAIGMKFRNETGKSFTTVFSGAKPGMPLVEIVKADLVVEMKIAGMDYLYTVTIRLTHGARTKDFTAVAKYLATGLTGPAKAAKSVTEDAIADLAGQVKDTLRAWEAD